MDGRTIRLEGDVPALPRLRLSDRLLDLDRPLTVFVNGRQVFAGKVQRNAAAILSSLAERADPASVATAILSLD